MYVHVHIAMQTDRHVNAWMYIYTYIYLQDFPEQAGSLADCFHGDLHELMRVCARGLPDRMPESDEP
jgi:hypothetical protein